MEARMEFLHLLYARMDEDNARKALDAFDVLLSRYNIAKAETGLTTYDPTNEPLVQYYIESCKLDGVKDSTIRNKTAHLRDFTSHVNTPMRQVTPLHCRAYMSSVAERRGTKGEKITAGTYNSYRSSISAFFEWCVGEGLIDKNPMATIKRKREIREVKQSISGVEVELLRRAAKTEQDRLMLEVMLGTGCRISELRLLKARDFDFRRGTVLLYGVKTSEYRESITNAKMEVALDAFLNTKKNPSEYLFASEKGGAADDTVTTRALQKRFKNLCKRAGIERNIHAHDTRRTFATTQMHNGTGVVVVQHLLGHKSLATTQVYLDTNSLDFSEARRRCV